MEKRPFTGGQTKKNTNQISVLGKVQPQARELEEAVLGALMLEKDAYTVVSDILKPECFYEHNHQLIYKAIVAERSHILN